MATTTPSGIVDLSTTTVESKDTTPSPLDSASQDTTSRLSEMVDENKRTLHKLTKLCQLRHAETKREHAKAVTQMKKAERFLMAKRKRVKKLIRGVDQKEMAHKLAQQAELRFSGEYDSSSDSSDSGDEHGAFIERLIDAKK